MKENKFRNIVRNLIKEEISSSERKELTTQLQREVSECVEKILLENGVHKKGLSEQQASNIYRNLVKSIDSKLDEFTSKKRPEKFKDYQQYVEEYDL